MEAEGVAIMGTSADREDVGLRLGEEAKEVVRKYPGLNWEETCKKYFGENWEKQWDEGREGWGKFVLDSRGWVWGRPDQDESASAVYDVHGQNVEFPVFTNEDEDMRVQDKYENRREEKHMSRQYCYLKLYVAEAETGCYPMPSATANVADSSALLWQTLPEAIVEKVLMCLPPAAQARCRAVCKGWLAMIEQPEFGRRSFVESLSRTEWPCLCAHSLLESGASRQPQAMGRRNYFYSNSAFPLYNTWTVDMSFLPQVFQAVDSHVDVFASCCLICITRRLPEGTVMCVVNPVNMSFKVLPMLHKLWSYRVLPLAKYVTDATEILPSFLVYLLGVSSAFFSAHPPVKVPGVSPAMNRNLRNHDGHVTIVYNSITGRWKGMISHPLKRDITSYLKLDPILAYDGHLYAIDGRKLLRLSMESGPHYVWDLTLPQVDGRWGQNFKKLGRCFVVEHSGRILYCSAGIWTLDDTMGWVKIARRCPVRLLLPDGWESRTSTFVLTERLVLIHVKCFKDLIIFIYGTFFFEDGSAVAYDMRRNVWRRIPVPYIPYANIFQPTPNLRLIE